MTKLDDVRLEAFARAVARGLGPHEASKAVGYARGKACQARKRMERRPVAARITELRGQRSAARMMELGPEMEGLLRCAALAEKLNTVESLVVAHKLLAESSRLKLLLAREGTYLPPDAEMSDDEWSAAYRVT